MVKGVPEGPKNILKGHFLFLNPFLRPLLPHLQHKIVICCIELFFRTWYEILPGLKSNSGMISYHGLDGFPPGGMFSYRVVGNQTTLVGFLTGRLDFIPDPLVGLDVAVYVDCLTANIRCQISRPNNWHL